MEKRNPKICQKFFPCIVDCKSCANNQYTSDKIVFQTILCHCQGAQTFSRAHCKLQSAISFLEELVDFGFLYGIEVFYLSCQRTLHRPSIQKSGDTGVFGHWGKFLGLVFVGCSFSSQQPLISGNLIAVQDTFVDRNNYSVEPVFTVIFLFKTIICLYDSFFITIYFVSRG